ncbi:hypothetical protein CAP35_10925 [Chitinophagaceae bacterium IBVUCB1]|nr:hypothetical protein CAP35_10925 [Chitinophagaceae bacterium IBVUCB1]
MKILYCDKHNNTPMSNAASIEQRAKKWLDNGMTDAQIENELLASGTDARHIGYMLIEIKKLRNARKTANGLIFILVGAVTCLLSCVLTMTSSYSNSNFSLVLYGFTTIGIIIVFVGLMKIFN